MIEIGFYSSGSAGADEANGSAGADEANFFRSNISPFDSA